MSNVVDINEGMKKHLLEVNEASDSTYNIIDVRWFSMERIGIEHTDPIGIVLVEDPTMHYVFAVMGTHTNPQEIAAWGVHLDQKMAEGVFGYEMHDYKKR